LFAVVRFNCDILFFLFFVVSDYSRYNTVTSFSGPKKETKYSRQSPVTRHTWFGKSWPTRNWFFLKTLPNLRGLTVIDGREICSSFAKTTRQSKNNQKSRVKRISMVRTELKLIDFERLPITSPLKTEQSEKLYHANLSPVKHALEEKKHFHYKTLGSFVKTDHAETFWKRLTSKYEGKACTFDRIFTLFITQVFEISSIVVSILVLTCCSLFFF